MDFKWITIVCVTVFLNVKMPSVAVALPDNGKPGFCPVNKNFDLACAPLEPDECITDGGCPGRKKCCSNGCLFVCLNPVAERKRKNRQKRKVCLMCCGPPPCCNDCNLSPPSR